MFDPAKRKEFHHGTVNQLIAYLSTLNPFAEVTILGDPDLYVHVEQDGSTVVLDDNSMEDQYPDDEASSSK
jgi:hypothetical protein